MTATPSLSGAQVDWQTSAAANAWVEYGTTSSYGSTTPVDATMAMSHQVGISGLKSSTQYHYRVHSTDANNSTAAGNDQTFTTTADTTPPTVSITSPAANSTLSGTVSVTATAADNVAVATVQFKVDGANSGAALTAAPYSYALNTTTLSDGNHVLSAVATDAAGNSATSATVAVKVNNTTPAPSISGLNPTSGVVGTSVTISGANFGATQGTSTVKFNGTTASVTSWSAASIVATVPAGASTGSVVVTVGGVASNGVNFTVTTTSSAMGPLTQSTVNSRYFVDPSGNAVFLVGSHTWNDFQDTDTSLSPAA
ncbi:MAG TPA: Ig-like domain-containing protein, partial [Candidatus Acidoferrales bacterium]|nr:Ig-like domain-containing protein [Candidatus Acidoferrales bacterium]